jgi:anti-sigma factor RsiW
MRTPTTPLSCRELVELVNDYVEGVLPESERARFDGHVGCCDWCVAYVVQFRETIAVAGQVDPGSIAPDVEAHMLSAFRDWKSGRPGPA